MIPEEGISIIAFYADWCGPCKLLKPIVDEFAEERSEIAVSKVNVDEEKGFANIHNIIAIPTVLFCEGGVVKKKHVGLIGKDGLTQEVDRIRGKK